jgi:rod shape-determining protein MreD
MRNPLVQILILAGVIIAETTLLKDFGISGVRPAFYLVCFIFLAYSQGSVNGVIIGFSTGLILDFVSIAPLGFSAFSLSLIGYGLSSLRGKLFLDPIFMPILLTVVVSILNWLGAAFLVSVFQIEPSKALVSGSILLQIALNALIAPVVYGIFRLSGAIPHYLREEER